MKQPLFNSIFITLSILAIIISLSLMSRPVHLSKKLVIDSSDFNNAQIWFKRKYQVQFKLNEEGKIEIHENSGFRYLFKRVPFLKALESQEVLLSYHGFQVYLSELSHEQESEKLVDICVPQKQLKSARLILSKHDLALLEHIIPGLLSS